MIDLLGGSVLAGNLAALAPKGRLVLVGLLGGTSGPLDLSLMLRKRITIVGTTLRARPLEEKIAATVRFASEVVPWLERGLVRPVVDSVFRVRRIPLTPRREWSRTRSSARSSCGCESTSVDSHRARRGSVRYQGLANCRRRAAVAAGELPILDLQDKVVRRDKPAVVGHDHQGRPRRLLKAPENRVDLVAGFRVELAGRLVGEDQDRLLHQCPGDRHPLLFAAGKLVGAVVEPLAKADLRQQIDRPAAVARPSPRGAETAPARSRAPSGC